MLEQKLEEAMAVHGLHPKQIIANSKINRFDADKKGKRTGWYILHKEGWGAFGDWATGLEIGFNGDEQKEITPADRQKWRDEANIRRQEEIEKHKRGAIKANEIWNAAPLATDEHPYLRRKKVKAYGLKVDAENRLIVPMRDEEKKIVSLQYIPEQGEKKFMFEGRTRGCYFAVGTKLGKIIYIAEGFATAATIHHVTGEIAVVAFTASNLESVNKLMAERYPDIPRQICADNDQWKLVNAGLNGANKAAAAAEAEIVMPEFAPEDAESKPTDFNDMANMYGDEAVKEAIQKPMEKKRALPNYAAPLIHTAHNGKPYAVVENLNEICRRTGIKIRYNVISKAQEITVPGLETTLDNKENASLGVLVSECRKFLLPTDHIEKYITVIADSNRFNPIADWITSSKWDGVSRLQEFYDTIRSTNEPLKETILKRWMVSAIAASFEPDGVSASGVLVFQGAQYMGKTAWFKSLVPAQFDAIKDGVILRLDDKDSVLQALSHWLVELGELEATFKKSDIAQLKAFLTSDRDIIRASYAARASRLARRTVFFASVNQMEFLHDTTGNRRFWSMECLEINYKHKLNMQQIWAEFYELYKAGEPWHLSKNEMMELNDHNRNFEVTEVIDEKIRTSYDWQAEFKFWKDWKSASQVCADVGIANPTKSDTVRAGKIVADLNGNKSQRTAHGRKQLVPPLITGTLNV